MLKIIIFAARFNNPGISVKSVKNAIYFILKSLWHYNLLMNYYRRIMNIPKFREIALQPDILGLVIWPYVNNIWDVEKKFYSVADHYKILNNIFPFINNYIDNIYSIIEIIDFIYKDVRLVIDRPSWFCREGQLVLSIFHCDIRVSSLAFSLSSNYCGKINIIIGAIQGLHGGIKKEQYKDINKNMVKKFYGLRPRSLLVECIRAMAKAFNVSKILAVDDQHRIHKHKYFGINNYEKFRTNYNDFWIEHGGVSSDFQGFYEIPIKCIRRDESNIVSKKRSMYRRRYLLLEEIEELIVATLECRSHGF